jgi:chorismate synthase
MMRIGEELRMTIFGTSHGPEVGVEVEGLPAGTLVDLAAIQRQLDRRRPVGRRLATRRQEEDRLVVDHGVANGRSDGSTFRAHVANEDVRREPYDRLRNIPRPGHADFPARVRYGAEADLSGGGIFSGRMTVGLVIAGTLAAALLSPLGVQVVAFTRSIGAVESNVPEELDLDAIRSRCSENEVETPDPVAAAQMEAAILEARRDGDSLGGVVELRAEGLPVGLGEPFFDSVESVLAHLFFSIPAVKGVEFGAGFHAARMRGSEHNDPFVWDGVRVRTSSNHAGGVLGGLTTGMPVVARVAVKPTSSIARPQRSVDLATQTETTVTVTGRHDPCIVPRAVGVVEHVAAFGLADLALRGGFVR